MGGWISWSPRAASMGAAGRLKARLLPPSPFPRKRGWRKTNNRTPSPPSFVNGLGPERVLDVVVKMQGRVHIRRRREAAIGERSMVGGSIPTVVRPFAFGDAHRLVPIRRAEGGKQIGQG